VPPAAAPAILAIPLIPSFSPAAIAALLQVYRSNVHYWLVAGKLESFTDNIGDRYVPRAELVRFVREFLARPVDE
jgi:hypothetical protein